MGDEEHDSRFSHFYSQLLLALRGFGPLLLLALALLLGPALLLWWLRGGEWGLASALIGGAISLVLLLGMALIFGWAVGRLGRRRRK